MYRSQKFCSPVLTDEKSWDLLAGMFTISKTEIKTRGQILVWWKSTMNEVYPWSPAVKDHDRANVHLYRLTGYVRKILQD